MPAKILAVMIKQKTGSKKGKTLNCYDNWYDLSNCIGQ